ncbi:hypothetical protein cyc_00368 [Cyclospora cayetanensis]|uniref:Uncharacterized protein n=1 Tax=Cyclospora cayetanensis TaxID=88456 RepID=A0A1D3CXS3_9EIME|nr:hypothetical protein cyc_00368 [Cyclospora cayetanensis]
MYTPYEIDASEGFSRGPPGGFLSAHSVGSAKETPGGPPLVEGGTALGATGNEVLVDSDVEDSPPLLCPPPPALQPAPAGTPAAVQGATGLESWLFCSFDSEAASLQPPNPPSQRSVWGRNLDRASLEAELKAAIEGPPGSLQWLHALSHVAADEQAAQAILDIAAMDPSFPCAGVQRQILLTLCSLSVDTSRINDVLNLVFGPTDQPAATDEQRIGRIIKKTTEAGALQERKMQQQLHRQTLFAGDEAWSFLWHLVGLAYQREAASPSSSQAAFRRCSALCFLCALQLSPFSLCSFEAALPVGALAAGGASSVLALEGLGGRGRVCSDTSFFLLVPPRQSPMQFLEAALNPSRVGRIMRRFCSLLLLQQRQAAVRMQQSLQQQLQEVAAKLQRLQELQECGEVNVKQQRQGLLLQKQQRELLQLQRRQQQWLAVLHAQQHRRWQLQQDEAVWKSGSRLFSHSLQVIGNDAEAIRFLRKAGEHPAVSGDTLVAWAACAARLKDAGEQQRVALIALDVLSPEEPYLWCILGLYFSCANLQDEAVEAFYKAIHLGDFFSEAFALCGRELTLQNQLEQASASVQGCTLPSSGSSFPAAYEVFEAGLSRHVPSYPLLYGLAALLQRQGKYAEAAQVICCCLRLFSSRVPQGLSRLAHCMHTAGHTQKAASLYKRATARNPRDAAPRLQLAMLQFDQGQNTEASHNLLLASRLSPHQKRKAWRHMNIAALLTRDSTESSRLHDEALQIWNGEIGSDPPTDAGTTSSQGVPPPSTSLNSLSNSPAKRISCNTLRVPLLESDMIILDNASGVALLSAGA